MDTFLKDKKINSAFGAVSLLALILSVFFIIKIVNEVKTSRYIGDSSQYPNVIYVNGEGEVSAVPDIASLYINLTEEAKTAKEAQNLLNEKVTKTLSYLKDQKIEEKDIKSEYGGLNPKYSYNQPACYSYPCPSRDPKIIGYVATQSISIKIRDVDNSNEIRTGLAELKITDISGPTFSIDDEDIYKAEARSMAIKDARTKAEILAKDLGVKLGKVVNFSENNGSVYPMMYKADMMEGAAVSSAPAPELPKGENKIISSVTITYEIK